MNITLRTKLVGSFTVILLALAIVAWRGITGMSDINEELISTNTEQFIPARMIANANIALIAWNRAALNHVLAENTQRTDEYERIMLDQKAALLERLHGLSDMENLSSRGQELLQELQGHFQTRIPR